MVVGEEGKVSFSVGNGPSSVKISSALKKINYSSFYRLNLKSDNISIMDLDAYGSVAKISLSLELEDGMTADVWNITSSGAITHISTEYTRPYVSFMTSIVQFYAVGSTGNPIDSDMIIDPRGEIDVDTYGSGMDGHATLVGIIMDNKGETMYLPSYIEGCTLRTIGPGSLNGLVNTTAIVIPVTVSTFSWNDWNNGITDVYFLGDAPTFEGTAPSTVKVHYTQSASGWDGSIGNDDLVIYRYDGSYKKDIFAFTYFIVDERVTVHRYLFGNHVSIPESIAVDGMEYPVTCIGDAAFMFTRDSSIKDLYNLRFSNYNLVTIELNSSVTHVMTCAFYGSPLEDLLLLDSLEYIWDHAFHGCERLNNVTFPNSLVFIGRSAFEGCVSSSFARIDLPDSVKCICERAFRGCTGVMKVTIGNGMSSIPDHCFEGCVKVTELVLSDSVRSIGSYAFRDCVGLKYVDLNKASHIGIGAFQSSSGSSALEFVVIGKNLSDMSEDAFSGNTSLMELEIHCSHFDSFESAFHDVGLDNVTLFVANEYLDGWRMYNAVPLVEEEEKDDRTLLHTVEIGLLVFFIVIGVVSYFKRSKV